MILALFKVLYFCNYLWTPHNLLNQFNTFDSCNNLLTLLVLTGTTIAHPQKASRPAFFAH